MWEVTNSTSTFDNICVPQHHNTDYISAVDLTYYEAWTEGSREKVKPIWVVNFFVNGIDQVGILPLFPLLQFSKTVTSKKTNQCCVMAFF